MIFFMFFLCLDIFSKDLNKEEFLKEYLNLKEKNTWNIGVASFLNDQDNEYSYLRDSLSNIIYNKLLFFKEHKLSGKEKNLIINNNIASIIEKKEKILYSYIKEKSDNFFIKKKDKELDEKIIKLKKELKYLKSIDFKEDINNYFKASNKQINDNLKISLIDKNNLMVLPINFFEKDNVIEENLNDKKLNKDSLISKELKVYSKDYNLDMLLFGHLTFIKDYIYIQTYLYNSITQELDSIEFNTTLYKVNNLEEQILSELATLIMGQTWHKLNINSLEDSSIYIDDKFKGNNHYSDDFFLSGIYSLSIKKDGYKETKGTIIADQDLELNIDLEEKEKKMMFLNTSPSGAKVYLNSIYQGLSPLKIEVKEEDKILKFVMQDYKTKDIIIKANSQNKESNFDLKYDIINKEANFLKAKRSMYMSLGIFAGSVVIPVIFHGLYRSTSNTYLLNKDYLNDKTKDNLLLQSNTYYWFRNGGIILSSILFVNLIDKIVKYISSSEELFN